jgi:ribosomal protein S27E
MNVRTTYLTPDGGRYMRVRCPDHPTAWVGPAVTTQTVATDEPCDGGCHPDINQPVTEAAPPVRHPGLTNADITTVNGTLSTEIICDCGAVTVVPVGDPPSPVRGVPVTCAGCRTVHWVTIVLVGAS